MNLLNLILSLPLLGFFLVLIFPKERTGAIRILALGIAILTFVGSLGLIGPYWYANPQGFTFQTDTPWIDSPAIRYHMGIDGLTLWLVILTTLLTPLCVLISWRYIDKHIKEFFAFLLLLEFGLIGVFCALDLFLFYVFWEIALVPMYFLIGVWGYDRRIYAAVKFFLYTMAASVLMLGAIIYVYGRAGTFDYPAILAMLQSGKLTWSAAEQLWLFLAFFLAFAVKVPLFPLHTWLPDAHVEAPTAGSVMLASVMLKMGTYGLVRYCLPMFPNAARRCAGWIIILAIIGIVYGALVAMVQPNMKKLVAYSSVSHLGFVVLGIFSFTQNGLDGAVYQMLNHGVSTGALFMLVGFLYERRHSLEIKDYGGVATPAPNFAIVFMIAMLASIGLPTLNNFIGEYLVLQGAALVNFKWAVFAAIGVILAACYMLWMYQRTFLGKPSDDLAHHMYDLNAREYAALLPLIVLMVWMGTFTQSFLPSISATNARILAPIEAKQEFQVRATPAALVNQTTAELQNAR
ncbi:MAG: NADH-quinone oxidoreductase subunit M [Acidobacteriota bacterium]|nr:NADH-quinone oxidoreductase subunit M [Acidobacteriota bacterium]